MPQTECDWCGKIIDVHQYRLKQKFVTCSKECKYNMLREYMQDKWDNLTPEQRDVWTSKLGAKDRANDGNSNGLSAYHKSLRPARVKEVVEKMSQPAERTSPNGRNANKGQSGKYNPRTDPDHWLPRGTCTLIAAHHEMLKDDPERLSTDFMQKICRVNCGCRTKKEEPE